MLSKRVLPMVVATLVLGLGFASSAGPASAGTAICYTVSRTAPMYNESVYGTQIGTAYAGDIFEDANGEIGHGSAYGTDQRSGQTGWISFTYLDQWGPGCLS